MWYCGDWAKSLFFCFLIVLTLVLKITENDDSIKLAEEAGIALAT